MLVLGTRFPAPLPGELLPPVMTMTSVRGAEILACTPLESTDRSRATDDVAQAAESLALGGQVIMEDVGAVF